MAFAVTREGITDADAAHEIGVPLSTYQSWKYGTAKPNYMNGRRFEQYFDACIA